MWFSSLRFGYLGPALPLSLVLVFGVSLEYLDGGFVFVLACALLCCCSHFIDLRGLSRGPICES